MMISPSKFVRPAIASVALLTAPLALSCLAAPPTPPSKPAMDELPGAKELIKKAHQAAGGEKGFKDVKTAQFEVTLSAPQGEQNMNVYTMRPRMIAFDAQTPGGNTARFTTNGKYAWGNSPQDTGMQVGPAAQLGPIQPIFNVQNTFLEFGEEFRDHKTAEKTEFAGRPAYRVEATDKLDASKTSAFFDAENGEFLGLRSSFPGPMGPMPVSSTVKEWQEIDGRKFVRVLEMSIAGQVIKVKFDKIDVNGPDESMFEMPEMVKEQIKALEEQEKAAEDAKNDDADESMDEKKGDGGGDGGGR